MIWSSLTSRKTAGLNALRACLVNEADGISYSRADWLRAFLCKPLLRSRKHRSYRCQGPFDLSFDTLSLGQDVQRDAKGRRVTHSGRSPPESCSRVNPPAWWY